MASLRSVCGPAVSLAWIAALASGAFAQPATDPVPDAAALRQWRAIVNAQLAAIAREEAQSGPFSESLVDPLMQLGLTQQEYGEHELAVESLARARQITRVNQGLYTLEQAPMLRQMMASELATGHPESAAELEGQLLQLARRNRGDLRTVPIFRDAGDRQLSGYERYLTGDARPVLTPAVTIGFAGSQSWSSAPARPVSALWQARRHYMAAIGTLWQNRADARDELVDLERTLIRTYYLELQSSKGDERSPVLWAMGRRSYGRLLSYSATGSAATAAGVAGALVELADWDLLFSRNGVAVDLYAQAYGILLSGGVPKDAIREIFPTDTPVLLPAFVRDPLVTATDEATDYVDIAFDLTKYGKTRRENVVATAGPGADKFANDAKLFLARNRFRPSPPGAEPEHAEPYRLRYYVTR